MWRICLVFCFKTESNHHRGASGCVNRVNFFTPEKVTSINWTRNVGHVISSSKKKCTWSTLQNSSESLRFWGLHMDGKSLHMADFVCTAIFLVYTCFDCRENDCANAVNLSKNNVGTIVSVLYVALKCYISQNFRRKITMNLICLHKVWSKFTQTKKQMFTASLNFDKRI